MSITLDEKQQLAVDKCIAVIDRTSQHRIAATTGPAGSGKTTILKQLADYCKENNISFAMCAPTGKAARRIREATGYDARTIHMLLEYSKPGDRDPRTGKPRRDSFPRKCREDRLTQQVIIVDEYMMVFRELHDNLLAAMAHGAVLIAFGDVSQLPPIEKGLAAKGQAAFVELLQKFNGTTLTRVHRQGADSGILLNANRVLDGKAPQDAPDFVRINTNTPVDTIRTLVKQADYNALHNQIITPANVSFIGTHKLNSVLQGVIHPEHRPMVKLDRHTWNHTEVHVAVGDKIIMKSNWYQLEGSDGTLGVYNGETGIITEIDFDINLITVDFGDRTVQVPPVVQDVIEDKVITGYPQKDMFLAYVITTHGAQGSEYKHVTYVINRSILNQCNRRNLYTGLTRAREHVNFVFDMASISASIMNKEPKAFDR